MPHTTQKLNSILHNRAVTISTHAGNCYLDSSFAPDVTHCYVTDLYELLQTLARTLKNYTSHTKF